MMAIRYLVNVSLFILVPSCLFSVSSMAQEGGITVKRVAGSIPLDPTASLWQETPAQEVAVMTQQVTMPMLAKAAVDKVSVRALTDGQIIAWQVSWLDKQPDFNVDTGRFSDAVALEFPITADAAVMMGHKGYKVQILYWKGLWQKDVDKGFQDVQDVHPNYWADMYWFAEGEFPYRVPDAFKNPVAQQWFVAHQAGNPMSDFNRAQPVEEMIAEGWGTLTHQAEAVTTAKGVWADGQWQVVFARPLATQDANDHQFALGEKSQMAFAVWQGAEGNVGGRKQWSNWTAYQIQP